LGLLLQNISFTAMKSSVIRVINSVMVVIILKVLLLLILDGLPRVLLQQ